MTSHTLTMVARGNWVPLRLSGDQTVTEVANLWYGPVLVSRRKNTEEDRGGRPWLPLSLAVYYRDLDHHFGDDPVHGEDYCCKGTFGCSVVGPSDHDCETF